MVNVGIVGASGYTGGELLRLLVTRQDISVTLATSRKHNGDYVFRVHPNLKSITNLKFSNPSIDEISKTCDYVFLAVPHGSAVNLVPKLLEVGIKVIDLSADFRLKNPKDYERWYGFKHPFPDLLEKAVYGLPELHFDEIRKAELVANPGCTATASILSLAPLVKNNLIDAEKIIVDVKIGSSGVGGTPSIFSHHPERTYVVRPYQVVSHRHTAEVEQELKVVSKKDVKVGMTPHAVDIVRGILSTSYGFTNGKPQLSQVWHAYRAFYNGRKFIRFVKDQHGLEKLPDPKYVIGSNFCDIGFELDERFGRIVAFSAIDNLMKGAAGQAVQNLNIMLGLDETTGLLSPSLHPV